MSEGLPAPASAGRWSRWILFVSLAVNLFFLGAWAALAWRHFAWEHHRPWTPATRIDRLAEALPPADADKLRAEYRDRQNNIEAAIASFRQAQHAVREALRAEPFDPAALRAAMAEARSAHGRLDETLQDVIATAVATMTPEGRRSLADWTPYRRSGR